MDRDRDLDLDRTRAADDRTDELRRDLGANSVPEDTVDRPHRSDDLRLNDPAYSASRSAEELRRDLGTNDVPEATAAATDLNRDPLDAGEQKTEDAVGAVGGAAVGAGIGTIVAGPIGTAIGAIAGAVGGWWASHASTVDAEYKDDTDTYYRSSYESSTDRQADVGWDSVRPAYRLGYLASRNPDYRGRAFEDIEPDLQRGWTDDLRSRYGDWAKVRPHVRAAYSRNPDLSQETTSERTVLRASETARDRLAGGRDGLRSDDTVGF